MGICKICFHSLNPFPMIGFDQIQTFTSFPALFKKVIHEEKNEIKNLLVAIFQCKQLIRSLCTSFIQLFWEIFHEWCTCSVAYPQNVICLNQWTHRLFGLPQQPANITIMPFRQHSNRRKVITWLYNQVPPIPLSQALLVNMKCCI